MIVVDEGQKQSAPEPVEDKTARAARVLAAAMAEKTKRLQEELAKHDEAIEELTSERKIMCTGVLDRLTEVDHEISNHHKDVETFTLSIEAQQALIKDLEEQIEKARQGINKLSAYLKESTEAARLLQESRPSLTAELDALDARRLPLINSHQKKREKVARRLALHLARYPETKGS